MNNIPITEIFLRWLNGKPEAKREFDAFRKARGAEMPFGYSSWASAFLGQNGLLADDRTDWLAYYQANRKYIRRDEQLRSDAIRVIEPA